MAVTITFHAATSGPTPTGAAVGDTTLVVDASLHQEHSQSNDVTEHPVEQGADITDNIRPKPRCYTIEGVISATPIVAPGVSPEPNRHVAAYRLLENAARNRSLVSVSTGLRSYANLAIESFSTSRSPEHGVDLYFTLRLKEVVFATTATATAPKSALLAGKPRNQASAHKHRGVRQATAATTAQTASTAKAAGNAGPKPKPRMPAEADWLTLGLNFLK